jgi:hypothetical protein
VAGWSTNYHVVWSDTIQSPSGQHVVWSDVAQSDANHVVWSDSTPDGSR